MERVSGASFIWVKCGSRLVAPPAVEHQDACSARRLPTYNGLRCEFNAQDLPPAAGVTGFASADQGLEEALEQPEICIIKP